jgi:hypothetical protein
VSFEEVINQGFRDIAQKHDFKVYFLFFLVLLAPQKNQKLVKNAYFQFSSFRMYNFAFGKKTQDDPSGQK